MRLSLLVGRGLAILLRTNAPPACAANALANPDTAGRALPNLLYAALLTKAKQVRRVVRAVEAMKNRSVERVRRRCTRRTNWSS
jgi:hypothetical protein